MELLNDSDIRIIASKNIFKMYSVPEYTISYIASNLYQENSKPLPYHWKNELECSLKENRFRSTAAGDSLCIYVSSGHPCLHRVDLMLESFSIYGRVAGYAFRNYLPYTEGLFNFITKLIVQPEEFLKVIKRIELELKIRSTENATLAG